MHKRSLEFNRVVRLRILGFGDSRVQGFWGLGFMVSRVSGLGFRVSGVGCLLEGFLLPRLLLSSNFIVATDESLTQYLSPGWGSNSWALNARP